MNCQQFKKLISDALDGELTDSVRADFEAHRTNCKRCLKEYNYERRIRFYLKHFPTVHSVSSDFREELLRRIKAGEIKPELNLNVPAILATFCAIVIVLLGVIFGIKAYRSYVFQRWIFIATYETNANPENFQAVTGGRKVSEPSIERGSFSRPLFVLNLQELKAESLVLRLLSKYQEGKVPESLVESLLVNTGILDGVRMRVAEDKGGKALPGRAQRIEVIFPAQLSSTLVVGVKGSDLPALRRFALDVISTFGVYVPVLAPEDEVNLTMKNHLNHNGIVTDLVRLGNEELAKFVGDKYTVLIILSASDALINSSSK